MLFFQNVGLNETLPVKGQPVRGKKADKLDTAAPGAGLQAQAHLCIVAKRLKVPTALHWRGNGFPIKDPAPAKRDFLAKACLDFLPENLQLDGSITCTRISCSSSSHCTRKAGSSSSNKRNRASISREGHCCRSNSTDAVSMGSEEIPGPEVPRPGFLRLLPRKAPSQRRDLPLPPGKEADIFPRYTGAVR